MIFKFAGLLGFLLLGGCFPAVEPEPSSGISPDIARLLKDAGAVSYAHKDQYGAGIDSMTIGYGTDDKPVAAVAVRNTKTYKEAAAIVAVKPADGSYTIAAAEIPDVASFHGKSRTLTEDALKDITGKVFSNADEARGLADAVTGPTKYLEAIYVSYSLMASKIVEELEANPDWPRSTFEP